jgi:hypothetical protein
MANDLLLSLGSGVISGLVASGLLLFFSSFWGSSIVPWYEERIYKDARIEGKWRGVITMPTGGQSRYSIDISRIGHDVSGRITGVDSGESYKMKGEFRNMILTLEYESSNPNSIDRGCFTMILINNGKNLKGCGSFYFPPSHQVEKADIEYARA